MGGDDVLAVRHLDRQTDIVAAFEVFRQTEKRSAAADVAGPALDGRIADDDGNRPANRDPRVYTPVTETPFVY
jgi:hypothetical protein